MAYTVPPGYAGIYCCYSMQLLHSIANPYTARYYKHVTLRTGTPEALEGKLRALRHFRAIKMSYVASLLIWRMLDEFQVESQNGASHYVVHRLSPSPSRHSGACFQNGVYPPAS